MLYGGTAPLLGAALNYSMLDDFILGGAIAGSSYVDVDFLRNTGLFGLSPIRDVNRSSACEIMHISRVNVLKVMFS